MRGTLFKSTIREIKHSFSRWLAILAICALGVGFFSGLKVCRDDFVVTGDQYFSQTNFYDFRLISTLGLEEQDVEAISHVNGVMEAEGSYSMDVLFEESDSSIGTKVAKFHTLSNSINTPFLLAGTLPTESNQCLVDERKFTAEDIGKKIKLSPDNKKDTLDFFKYDEYVISGVAQSPLYIKFERGTTSLGDGNVECFISIPADGFSSDYYTEIYVDLKENNEIYSDEYKEIVDGMENPLTSALNTCATRRYEKIKGDAEEEVSKAEAKLKDAEEELSTNESKLADAKEELSDGWSKYNQGVYDYNTKKEDTYAKLDELKAQAEGAKGTPYYDQLMAQYNSAKAEADKEFNLAWEKLKNSKAELYDGEAEISDGEAKIGEGKEKIKDAKAKLADARKEIDKIKKPSTYVLDRTANIGYSCFDNDTSIVNSIAKVFPIFFFLVAALVCMTTMTRMIDDQRTQIGVLKALGYDNSAILGKYLLYAASASLIGSILGFFCGIYLFPYVIWEAYGMMYDFAQLTYLIDWSLGLLSITLATLCCIGTTIFCCYHELNDVPSELIRPKAPPVGKRILLERIHFIWDKLKFLHKVCLRNIFRYKKRFFMMVVGISGCTALLITGFGIGDSIKNVVSMQYDEIFHSDYTITFHESLSEEEQKTFLDENKDVISSAIFIDTLSVDVRVNDKVKSVNMIVCDGKSAIDPYITLRNEEGAIPFPKEGQCVINSNLAENLNLHVGDGISMYDGEMNELKATVVALCDNYVYNYVYINDETMESQWHPMEINSAFALGIPDSQGEIANPHENGASIMKSDCVSAVNITEDLRRRVNDMMESLNYVIALVIFSAGALAFIVSYNLTNINITERIREIATIKVLGFYPRETNSYVFRENIILTAISALAGIPLGVVLHAFVMKNVQIDLLSFDIHIEPKSFILSVVLTFVFAIVVNLVLGYKLKKISMTESLKSIE